MAVVAEKWKETDLVAPIEFELENPTNAAITLTVSMTLNGSGLTVPVAPVGAGQMLASDFASIEVRGNNRTAVVPANGSLPVALYVFVQKVLSITTPTTIPFTMTISGATISTLTITGQLMIIRGFDIPYTLGDYINNPDLILDGVSKVESVNNVLTVSGSINGRVAKRSISLSPGEVLAVSEGSWLGLRRHYSPVPISLMTVPFKVRSKVKAPSGTELPRTASAGLTNIGFNFELADWQMDRYFSNGKKSTHRFSLGVWAAPTVEDLDTSITDGYLVGQAKSKQLFVSTGITLSYAYNDIAFVIVPAGWDVATSTLGKKSVYNKEWWWGFGIAVSPKLFATILNK